MSFAALKVKTNLACLPRLKQKIWFGGRLAWTGQRDFESITESEAILLLVWKMIVTIGAWAGEIEQGILGLPFRSALTGSITDMEALPWDSGEKLQYM